MDNDEWLDDALLRHFGPDGVARINAEAHMLYHERMSAHHARLATHPYL